MNKRYFNIMTSLICFVTLVLSQPVKSDNSFGYKNPVLSGFNPDPSICKVDSTFYMVTSSFEYFPGLPIYSSKDLIHWQPIGHCLTRESQLKLQNVPSSGGLFAPALRYHDGLFYVICTNVSQGGNFYCTAKDPAGEWSDPIWVPINSIDPDIFFDEDGKTYFVTQGSEGVRVTEIDIKTGQPVAEERTVWGGIGDRYPEAPHIYKKDGFYYLLIGEGGTEYAHSATIARSRNVYGPYDSCPLNPIITHCNRIGQENVIQGVGHADFIQANDGSWWAVFLGFRIPWLYTNFHILGRETFLAPVDWPKGGWPQVNGNGTVSINMEVPTLKQYPVSKPKVRTDFDNGKLGFEWKYLRNPINENYSFNDKKGHLSMKATPCTLDETKPVSFIGRRQTEYNFMAATSLKLNSEKDNEEAGMTIIQNNTHHYDLYLTKKNGKNIVQLRAKVGSHKYIAAEYPVDSDNIRLRIEGTPLQYTFSYSPSQKDEYKELGKMDTRYVSTEIAGGFTGVMIGLYASSNGLPTNAVAYYDWFDYEEK